MFIRKKKNKGWSISVQIIDKSKWKYEVFKTLWSSDDKNKVEKLLIQANQIVNKRNPNQIQLFVNESHDDLIIEQFIENISNLQIQTIWPELIYWTLFDRIGFNIINDELFRDIVITRLVYPTSKLKTVDYLYRYKWINIWVDQIYRFLDKLNDKYKDRVEQVSFNYTKNILKEISVVFYDMTTLYFEAEEKDDLRKIWFSKDGKFQCPQIMLWLLVWPWWLPIWYNIFEWNEFEWDTIVPVLEWIEKKYWFDKPVVIADAAMLSKKNLGKLEEAEYKFIIWARIKNETNAIKDQILKSAENIKDWETFEILKSNWVRLIISYSDKRAKKDFYNREKWLKKLRAKIKSWKLSKDKINNRWYNKFLSFKSDILVEIDELKVEDDKKWDWLKWYITNTSLTTDHIIDNYKHLWEIEKAFRISKTDLRIRPIYHRKKERIEAHICVSFVAYTIYKELERLLYEHKAWFSPQRASELTHNMYELTYQLPISQEFRKTKFKFCPTQEILDKVVNWG